MFTPGELESMPIELEKLMADLEMRIMSDVVRRININDEITRSADWQIYRLKQLGESKTYIKEQMQRSLKLSEGEIDKLYEKVIESGYSRDKSLYDATGKEFIPFKENEELQQLIKATILQTKQQMVNITQSLGFSVDMGGKTVFTPLAEYYQKILDNAMIDITSGAFDYNSTLKRVVNEMTKSGIRTVDFSSGWYNRIEVAARRALMTGVTQVTNHINDMNAKSLGTEYFEVSWHGSARPSHQEWQGRVFSRKDLESVCGLGTISGLCGANCYHSYYPFVPGISERTYTDKELQEMNNKENTPKNYNGKEYTTYEATQRQRDLETVMRKYRKDIKLLTQGKADTEVIESKQAKYREAMRQYSDFSKKMGLPQQKERIYIDGLGKVGGNGRLVKNIKSDIIKEDKQFGKKIGKHTKEYGLNPSKPEDRAKMGKIVDNILSNSDEVVLGNWRGQEGTVEFHIKGSDVVVVNNGKFVTILKGGIDNARVKDARKPKV